MEHILPENPTGNWHESFSKDIIEDYIYKIGNFTLLSQKRNQNIANSDFNKKIELYSKSEIIITKNISKYYTEWNADNIYKRQAFMAEKAKEIWKI